jgi:predicted RNA polymerase sigma factor
VDDPYAKLRDEVLRRVIEGPGESEPAVRRAAAEGPGVPPDLQALIDKVHSRAYTVTDADVARLQATYGDDQLFEIIVSAALGASRRRLFAGLSALEQAVERKGT